MRAPVIVGLVAATFGTSACTVSPAPVPTVFADGMITEITSPGEGLENAELLALGPNGEVLVEYRMRGEGEDDSHPFGQVLVDRDGSWYPIAEQEGNNGHTRSDARVSETTVVWSDFSWHPEEDFFTFWDRATQVWSRSSSITNEGEYLGLNAQPSNGADPVLVRDTVFFLSMKGIAFYGFPDLVPNYDDYDYQAIFASSPDGRTSLLFEPSDNWVDLGIDECASTTDRPVLWGVRGLDPFSFESVQIDVTDPFSATVIEGSGIPFSAEGYYFHDHSSRCGNDLLVQAGDLDQERRDHLGVISLESPDDISLLDAPESDVQTEAVALAPEWIAVTYGSFDFSKGPGGTSRPGQLTFALSSVHEAPLPALFVYLTHRDSGQTYTFEQLDYDQRVHINGDFITWENPDGSGPYVGRLTPPTG